MSKKKKADHIHKYKKVDIGAYGKPPYLVYKCIKPGCTHYVPVSQSLNLIAECNRCHDAFVMSKATQLLALPHCMKCTKHKKGKEDNVESVAEYLSKLGL